MDYLEPFYLKVGDVNARIGFGYKAITVLNEGEGYDFIPIEAKEIVVNTVTKEVLNLSDVFVFQRAHRFLRLPVYQLLLISDIGVYLHPIVEDLTNTAIATVTPVKARAELTEDVGGLIAEIEIAHLHLGINKALDERDEETFTLLSGRLNEVQKELPH